MKFTVNKVFWLILIAIAPIFTNASESHDVISAVFEMSDITVRAETLMPAEEVAPVSINPKELDCLSRNIYFEAGNQPYLGKIGVGVVTMNRANHENFPNSICSVVNQKTPASNGRRICQFSWVCDGGKKINISSPNWNESLDAARALLSGGYKKYQELFEGALFFHATHVESSIRAKKNHVVRIGEHIFYR